MSLRVAITGARGYLGSTLVRHFRESGCEAAAWQRGAEAGSRYELAGGLESLDWTGVGAVVHCAYDFRARGWEEIHRVNVEGSLALLREAVSHGARFVFISSMSSYEGCHSLYGRAKLDVEKPVLEAGGTVIRPGLIYGDPPGGLFATLCRAVRALSVLPMIGSGKFPQYLAHHGDLARLVAGVAGGSLALPARPHSAAHPRPILFRDLLREIAALQDRRIAFLPVPWRAIYAAIFCAERAGLGLSFRADSLIGLVRANPAPAFDLPEGYLFRPFPEGAGT
ncbi:MAG: NAD-dependent epimerase/dehydratase family protein [Verrucomicrobiae bacterium]